MKKLLFATAFASTALASSMGCNTDTLTGLHFGLGVSVLFDKYEADVDVATIINGAGAATVGGTQNLYCFSDVQAAAGLGAGNTNIGDVNAYAAAPATTSLTTVGGTVANVVVHGTHAGTAFAKLSTAYIKHNTFKKRTTNCGGEVKLAYFHDFGNHLMVGVDLTGIIASKNKKTVSVSPETIAATERALNAMTNADVDIRNMTTGGNIVAVGATPGANTHINLVNGATISTDDILRITNMPALKAANPGFHTIMDATQLPEGYALKTTSGDNGAGELTFEKGVFNPRLAFIVGGTVYGWFAGLRMGMSYTTGKVYAKGLGQDKMSKTVSISSPLIGLHLMKQMKIAGNNDAHLYLTADWNIGDGRRTVDINGVKSFRQTSYNISAGVTWRFKLGN